MAMMVLVSLRVVRVVLLLLLPIPMLLPSASRNRNRFAHFPANELLLFELKNYWLLPDGGEGGTPMVRTKRHRHS